MNARKCDRCGAYYEVIQKAGIVHYRDIIDCSADVKDLCPSCYAELKDWFNVLKESETK